MYNTLPGATAQWFEDPRLRLEYLTGGDAPPDHPPEISDTGAGGKFSTSGAVLDFPGNTFICHIDPSSNAHAALKRLSEALQIASTGEYFSFLPPSSFHMTVFPAICGDPLGHDGWPDDMATGTPLSEFNDIYGKRFADTTRFEKCTVKPIGTIAGTSIILDGFAASDCTVLWHARRILQEVTRLYRPDFETYKFHISICYRTRWMDAKTAAKHLAIALPIFDKFKQDVEKIDLGPVEFCEFANMHHFGNVADNG